MDEKDIEFINGLIKGDKEVKQYLLGKLRKSPLLSYIPHSIQRQFHDSHRRIRWFLGGNRSGKTRAGAQEVLWYATGTHPHRDIKPPVDIWVISQDFPTSRDVTEPIIHKVTGEGYRKHWYAADKILELTNGSTIGFKSNDSGWEKFQGTKKHLIWFDEEPDYPVYQECLMRVVDTKGDIIGTMTPTNGMSWVFDEVYMPWKEGSSKDIECFIASIYDNPYIGTEERKFIEDKYFDEERQVRLFGKFVSFAGMVYKEYDRNIHVVKRFIIPLNWTKLRGLDPGVNNPTACIWLAISPDNDHYIYDEYCESDRNVEENAKRIKTQTGLANITTTYIDPSACNRNPAHPELKSLRDEYARFGIYTVPANNDVLFGINRVKEKLKVNEKTGRPRTFIFDDCLRTQKEIVRYRWDTYRHHESEKNPKEKPKKIMDHLMDGWRYIEAADPIYLGDYSNIDIPEEKSTRKFTKYG